MADVKVDFESVKQIQKEIRVGMVVALGRLGERGYQLLRREVPYQTGNLRQGVAPPDIDESSLTATLTVSARSARTGGGSATAVSASGKTKSIALRPQIAFNYAEVVAKGRPAIRPRAGRALLIEIEGKPSGGAYIVAGGKIFVVRKSAKAVAPNPFDERAAAQLETEAVRIVETTIAEIFS